MNAIELLKSDHKNVLDLFDQIDQAETLGQVKDLFREIKNHLELHTYIEETVFYPMFHNKKDFDDLIEDFYDDHQEVKSLLLEVNDTESEDDIEDKVEELMEAVSEHIDVEETELFPMIEEAFNEKDLEDLGLKMEQAKITFPRTESEAA